MTPKLKLDTSRTVRAGFVHYSWHHLEPIHQGFIAAMFAKSSSTFGYADLAPETLQTIIVDLTRYLRLTPGANDRDMGAMFFNDRQAGKWTRVCFEPLTITLGEDGKVRFE